MDLAALLARAAAEALSEARQALALVTRREFQRERDLLRALDTALDEFRG